MENNMANDSRMTDEEMTHALAGVLAAHPSWPQPRRFNVFAFSVEDAREALASAYGPQAQALTVLFRSDVIDALTAVDGKDGFWVGDQSGCEMFIETEDESRALALFAAQMGAQPFSCASSALVKEELARMEQALSGQDEAPLMSAAFVQRAAQS
jgi:hypothetical protein